MDLFNEEPQLLQNLLPYGGTVNYHGRIFSHQKAAQYFNRLLETIEWRNDEAVIFGKRIITKRKVAWYGEEEFEYTYSNITKKALRWTDELLELKTSVEENSNQTYNSCLLNLYHEGDEGMAWHSDGEKDLMKNGAIASLSFGAERKFAFKHKETNVTAHLILQNGSLLLMKDECQSNWLHRLPPTKLKTGPRINLTFRTIVSGK